MRNKLSPLAILAIATSCLAPRLGVAQDDTEVSMRAHVAMGRIESRIECLYGATRGLRQALHAIQVAESQLNGQESTPRVKSQAERSLRSLAARVASIESAAESCSSAMLPASPSAVAAPQSENPPALVPPPTDRSRQRQPTHRGARTPKPPTASANSASNGGSASRAALRRSMRRAPEASHAAPSGYGYYGAARPVPPPPPRPQGRRNRPRPTRPAPRPPAPPAAPSAAMPVAGHAIERDAVLTPSLSIVEGVQESGDTVDPNAVIAAFRSIARPIADCYEDMVDFGQLRDGEMELDFTVDGSGAVVSAGTSRDTVGDPRMTACVVGVLQGLHMTAGPGSGLARFSYWLRFTVSNPAPAQRVVLPN